MIQYISAIFKLTDVILPSKFCKYNTEHIYICLNPKKYIVCYISRSHCKNVTSPFIAIKENNIESMLFTLMAINGDITFLLWLRDITLNKNPSYPKYSILFYKKSCYRTRLVQRILNLEMSCYLQNSPHLVQNTALIVSNQKRIYFETCNV